MTSLNQNYRTEKETINLLRFVEKEDHLFEYKIDGWSIWSIFRFPIAFDLMNFSGIFSHPIPFLGKLHKILKAAQDIVRIIFLKKRKYFFKTLPPSQMQWEDGKLIDIYSDPIIELLGHSIKLEKYSAVGKNFKGKSIAFPSDASTAPIEVFAGFLSRFAYKREWRGIAEKISSSITKKLYLNKYTPRRILKEIAYFQYSKYFYRILLKRIDPSFVFVSNTGEFPLLAASKELKIKYIEMMHGVFTSDHTHAYSSSEITYRKSILIPDKIFIYGNYWKNQFKDQGFFQGELEITGNIRVDKYRSIRKTYPENERPNELCNILITTQGIDIPNLIKFLKETICQLPQEEFSFIFKLHPGYENSKQKYLKAFQNDSNVTILLGNEEPSTFSLLARVNFHISISSACHFDAIGIGVPTIILPLQGHEIVSDLIKKNHALLCRSPNELVKILKTKTINPLPKSASEFYFRAGALVSINRIIDKMSQTKIQQER